MKSVIRYTIIGLVSYLLFLLFMLPAARVVPFLPGEISERVYGLSGTLWSGQAEVVMVDGLRLEGVSWELLSSQLFTGRLAVKVALKNSDADISGIVAQSVMGQQHLTDLQGELDISVIRPLLKKVPAELDGRLFANFETLIVEQGRPIEAQGRIAWQKAAVSSPWQISLGAYRADVTTDEAGVIVVKLTDNKAKLGLAGQAQLNPQGAYQIDLELEPKDTSQPALTNVLRLIGRAGSDGKYPIKTSGQLPTQAPPPSE